MPRCRGSRAPIQPPPLRSSRSSSLLPASHFLASTRACGGSLLSSIAILVHRPDRLGALFPPALHVSRARLVPFPRFERHLAQEALIVRETVLVQPATGDGLDHRAPRLGVVRAVVEPAFPRQG